MAVHFCRTWPCDVCQGTTYRVGPLVPLPPLELVTSVPPRSIPAGARIEDALAALVEDSL